MNRNTAVVVLSAVVAAQEAAAPQSAPAVSVQQQPAPQLGVDGRPVQSGVRRPGFFETLSKMMPMIAMIFLIFFFFVIRPQTQKLRDQQTLVESLKKGEQVVTSSGIIGKVAGIEKGCILLEVSPNTKIRFTPTAIERRFEAKGDQKSPGEGAAA
jgi:preprotein translocase subunit YajC